MSEELRIPIGARLREERLRLGLNQVDFAAIGDVSKRSVLEWEKGALVPTAEFLARIAQRGADVLYVVTGQRIAQRQAQVLGVQLDAIELELLETFRACAKDDRTAVLRMTKALSISSM